MATGDEVASGDAREVRGGVQAVDRENEVGRVKTLLAELSTGSCGGDMKCAAVAVAVTAVVCTLLPVCEGEGLAPPPAADVDGSCELPASWAMLLAKYDVACDEIDSQ